MFRTFACLLSGILFIGSLVSAGCLTGCQPRSLRVSDFSESQGRAHSPIRPVRSQVKAAPSQQVEQDLDKQDPKQAESRPQLPTDRQFPMDAMVGQVNGQAVYASTVLTPIAPLLKGMGKRFSEDEFKLNAGMLIGEEIRKKIFDTLLIAEAERALTVRENAMIDFQLDSLREDLVRRHGRGSPVLADKVLKETTNSDLEMTVSDYRTGIVTSRHLSNKIDPRINITQRDVEKFYNSERGRKLFNPPSKIILRLLQAKSQEVAERFKSRLKGGESFETVAQDEANIQRGMNPMEVADYQAFAVSRLNEAIRQLAPGQYAGPIEVTTESDPELRVPVFYGTWWIEVVTKPSPPRKLEAVQLEIERILYGERKRDLQNQYTQSLLKDGTFTDPMDMTKALVDVAAVLFANQDNAQIVQSMNELIIRSTPEGAIVYVNGERKGPTPQVIWLDNGLHEIEVRKQGYKTYKQPVELKDRRDLLRLSPVLELETE